MQRTMHEYNGHGSVYGTIVTVFLYLLARFSISDMAAVATIFAGLTTGAFTLMKMWRLHKNKNSSDEKIP